MNIQGYKHRLLDIEKNLAARRASARGAARARGRDPPADAGDSSVADEDESVAFSEGELDDTVLQQVEDALRRIEDGSYGRCAVDGGPIEPKRLDAMPWTPYCLKHQQLL